MKSAVIRPALNTERGALEALQLRASLTNEGDRAALLAHPDAIAVPLEQIAAGDVFVLETESAIAGFAAVISRPDGDAELDALFVEPDRRREGAGRALVEHCAEVARQRGASALLVIGNPHAFDFYRACNFKVEGTVATRFGPGLRMVRKIEAAG